MISSELSPHQQRVLLVIKTLTKELGYSPTVDEIRQRLGSASKAPVHAALVRLQNARVIDWQPDSPRTIRVLPANKQVTL